MADKIVNTGLAILSGQVSIITALAPKYVGWGTGTTTAAITQTALVTPSSEARTSGTLTQQTTTTTNDTYQVVATITSTQTQAITEVGTFDASTTGNMYARSDFAAINVNNGDSITFTLKTKFTSA